MIEFIFYSFILGVATKFADLLDEHGLFLFNGAALLSGILWGSLFALLFLNNLFASFYLALLLHWLIRNRLDYLNHQVAASIVIISSLIILPQLNWLLFSICLFALLFSGLSTDYGLMRKTYFSKYNLFVFFAISLLALIKNPIYWFVFLSFLVNSIGYQLMKLFEKK